MRKQWIVLLLALVIGFQVGGCSSSDEKEDGAEASASEDGGGEATDSGDATASEEAPAEGDQAKSEEVNADFGDEQPPADQTASTDAPPTDAPPAETPPEPVPDSPPPSDSVATTPAPIEDTVPPTDEAPKVVAPLKKVKDAPFQQNGKLMNAVYVARAGDTWKNVSEKIYGNPGQAKDLKKSNPALSRPLKTGDKVYYNSPVRPTDDSAIKNYYEDRGLAAQTYTAKEGDNLKVVANELLGDRNGWKELWVTNPGLDSKGDLPAGTVIQYWPAGVDAGAGAPPPAVADAGAPPPPADGGGVPPPPPPGDIPPPPPPADMAGGVPPPPGDIPPPPPPAVGSVEPPPPPPPSEPPPPVEPPKPRKKFSAEAEGGMDQDTTMALAGSAVLILAGAALFLIVRKSRARKLKLGQTQV